MAARQLTDKNIEVLVLERGGDRTNGAEAKLPSQRDELRWDTHQGLVQDWSIQTYTLRYSGAESALPVRWMEAFLPGEGMGGAANHWNGHTWSTVSSANPPGTHDASLSGVACATATSCEAVGSFRNVLGSFTLGLRGS